MSELWRIEKEKEKKNGGEIQCEFKIEWRKL